MLQKVQRKGSVRMVIKVALLAVLSICLVLHLQKEVTAPSEHLVAQRILSKQSMLSEGDICKNVKFGSIDISADFSLIEKPSKLVRLKFQVANEIKDCQVFLNGLTILLIPKGEQNGFGMTKFGNTSEFPVSLDGYTMYYPIDMDLESYGYLLEGSTLKYSYVVRVVNSNGTVSEEIFNQEMIV